MKIYVCFVLLPNFELFLGQKGLNNNQFSTNDSDSSTDNVFQHTERVSSFHIELKSQYFGNAVSL